MWLRMGEVKKLGVVMTTPTYHALEFKPVKASISAFCENIQLKKVPNYFTKSYPALVVFESRKFSTLKTLSLQCIGS